MPEHKCEAHEGVVVALAKGDSQFKEIQSDLSELLSCIHSVQDAQSKFEQRMFVDNGTPCIQTRLINLESRQEAMDLHRRNHERWLWLVGAVVIGEATRVCFVWVMGRM